MNHKISATIAILVLFLLAVPIVSADSYELVCLGQGQTLDLAKLCNPAMDPRSGPTNICMHNLDNGNKCPANPNVCNTLGLSCSTSGGGDSLDQTPPVITLKDPKQNKIYGERAVPLSFSVSEKANVLYIDNLDSRYGWKAVCSDCISYNKERTFNEGFNNITFKAVDDAGNIGYSSVSFYVDSESPKIFSTEPVSGFSSGLFKLEFKESNPFSVTLRYGNSAKGYKSQALNIPTDCIKGDSYLCSKQIDLSQYDGQDIQYYFDVRDIANTSATSKPVTLSVDFLPPVFKRLNYTIDEKYVYLTIETNEPFLKEITYLDNNELKAKEKSLCKTSYCEKKLTFKDGDHNVSIIVKDQAGGLIKRDILFFTDSLKPKIKKVEPKNGFATGSFYIEFDEKNPVSLILRYGNSAKGYKSQAIPLSSCNHLKKTVECEASVSLAAYDSQEISYTFELEDRAGSKTTSKENYLDVDTTFPRLNNLNYTIKGENANFMLNITELNFDVVNYVNQADKKPTERKLCSNLKNSICNGKIPLQPGTNQISLIIYDDAGNTAAQSVAISFAV